jgi:uncharacterized membrane protein YhaH (DUF805 family)
MPWKKLFEFLFGASGRVNRAKYRREVLRFCIAGLMVAVILFTAASIAPPIFVAMVALIFIRWLLWGFAITTQRLHDRDKSARWLVTFYLAPGLLGQFAKNSPVDGGGRHRGALRSDAGGVCADDLGIY